MKSIDSNIVPFLALYLQNIKVSSTILENLSTCLVHIAIKRILIFLGILSICTTNQTENGQSK